MSELQDLLEVKKEISVRLLRKGLKGKVTRLHPSMNLTKAIQIARYNVHAVGIGPKVVSDKPTRIRSIRIHVIQKLPESLLSQSVLLPKEVDGFPVDVVESLPAFIFPARKRTSASKKKTSASNCSDSREQKQRPVVAGISSGHFAITAGTLTYFCHSTSPEDDPSHVFVLSNNHVFANLGKGKIGDDLYQPGPIDGGTKSDRFADLRRFVAISLGGTLVNHVDAAIGKLASRVAYTQAVCSIGKITSTATAKEGMHVRKHGRTSGYTEGRVTDISYDVLIGMDHNDPNVVAKFEDQVRIEVLPPFAAFGLGGDSGSLIVKKKSAVAVGLYFAGPSSGTYGVANQINQVLSELQIRFLV